MTIKGRRDKALRKMDLAEARSYDSGVWVDDSVPTKAVRAALRHVADQIDMRAFERFLGPRLGRYRAAVEMEQPCTADELKLIDELMDHIRQLQLRLKHLPNSTNAEIVAACWKHRHEYFHEFRERLNADLDGLWNLLVLAERGVEPAGGKVGRKAKVHRDWLLHDIAHWLQDAGTNKVTAAGIAAEVLQASGITVPTDPSKARKLVLQLEQLAAGNSR